MSVGPPGVGAVTGGLASFGISQLLSGVAKWVSDGAVWLVGQVGSLVQSSTTPRLDARWFAEHYRAMVAVAAATVLPLLLLCVIHAVVRQEPSLMVRAVAVQLPLAVVLTVVAVQVVQLSLAVVDSMCAAVLDAGHPGPGVLANLGKGLATVAAAGGGDPAVPVFVSFIVALIVAAGGLMLWLELVLRAAAIYVAVLFLPLALATLTWPALSRWARRLAEVIAALVLSKLVVVATLGLAVGALGSGAGFASVIGGVALLLLATFAPYALLRLIPIAEVGVASHLEGLSRRAVAAPSSTVGGAQWLLARAGAGASPSGPTGAAAAGESIKYRAGDVSGGVDDLLAAMHGRRPTDTDSDSGVAGPDPRPPSGDA
ncbi:MAG TPA: hypothetical protein VFA11_05335 [Acidimicrobiales bacterium]|nr:hypothetical protein [Acidimicrobiales bacterium]